MDILQLAGFENNFYETTQVSGVTSISTTTVRTGDYALRIQKTFMSLSNYVTFNTVSTSGVAGTNASIAKGYLSVYINIATLPSAGQEEIMSICQALGNKGSISVDSTGKLKLYTSTTGLGGVLKVTGTTVLSTGTWYRIDFAIGKESGPGAGDADYELRIDGVVEFSGSNGSTGTSNVAYISLGGRWVRAAATYDVYYDDFAWSGDGFPGGDEAQSEVHALFPDANGYISSWIKNTAGVYWTHVDDSAAPPNDGDTTYLYTSALNRIFCVSVEDPANASKDKDQVIPDPCNVLATKAHFAVRNIFSFPPTGLRYITRHGTTNGMTSVNDASIGTGWEPRYHLRNTNPDTSAAWQRSELGDVQTGVKYNAFSGTQTRCTSTLLSVLVVPISAVAGYPYYTPHAGI